MKIGLGFTIHDERDNHIFSRNHVMPGSYKPEEGEAIGLHEALSWIKELRLERAIIEMDAKLVVDAIYNSSVSLSAFGSIV